MNNNMEKIEEKNLERYVIQQIGQYLVENGLKDNKALDRFKNEVGNLDKKKGQFMHYCDHKYKKSHKGVLLKIDYDNVIGNKSFFDEKKEKNIETIFRKIMNTMLSELRYSTDEYLIAQTVNRLISRLRIIKNEIETLKNPKEEIRKEEPKKEEQKPKHSINDIPKRTSTPNHKFTSVSEEERMKQYERDKIKKVEDKIDKVADKIIDGPKANSLFGKDNNVDSIDPLYTFSIDVLTLMMLDQEIEHPSEKTGEFNIVSISNPHSLQGENIKKKIFERYGVNGVDQLLNKYSKIRDAYYQKYSKLNDENKKRYAFETRAGIHGTFDRESVSLAFDAEKFEFPPSKDKLIDMMNKRILSADRYNEYPFPKDNDGSEPRNYEEYKRVKDYFTKLSKNMNLQQMIALYNNAKYSLEDMYSYFSPNQKEFKYKELREDLLQKMFLEMIFERQGKKIADNIQLQQVYEKMAKEYFDEDLRFALTYKNELTEEDKKERANKVFEEFQKYEEHCKATKQEPMSLAEFAREKYGISNIKDIEYLIDNQEMKR